MSDWKTKMDGILSAGRAPTSDELEEALAGALAERNALARDLAKALADNRACVRVVTDMADWLGKMSAAFIRGDADKMAQTMKEFVEQRVKPALQQKGAVH